jgi:5-formaminoimidazole-4-carboxamide-1-(beta)-D-ribofuranosyl 5'-monophosphate synthetase
MISRAQITETLLKYDQGRLTIGTLCSHSALQIFYGARQEGFKTLGICTRENREVYTSFPRACPDEFLLVDNYREILQPAIQQKLKEQNTVMIPHGSFVEYVGPENLEDRFEVPMFGNRKTLEWEGDRQKQRHWLEMAGLQLPKEYKDPSTIDGRVFVKFSGAKGGRGFFTAESEEEIHSKIDEKIKHGVIDEKDAQNLAIQEFVTGVRYYPHYFFSIFEKGLPRVGDGRVELLSMDKRVEVIDENYRGLPNIPDGFFNYTVTGNQSIVIRESLLPSVINMGISTVKTSLDLFPPGMLGAFCLETIYHPDTGFTVFEVSARIVAGTNLFPHGSPYSHYLFDGPMSTGRRIAREIKNAVKADAIVKIIY